MNCKYCNAVLPNDAEFCSNCGKSQLEEPPITEEAASVAETVGAPELPTAELPQEPALAGSGQSAEAQQLVEATTPEVEPLAAPLAPESQAVEPEPKEPVWTAPPDPSKLAKKRKRTIILVVVLILVVIVAVGVLWGVTRLGSTTPTTVLSHISGIAHIG